MKSRLVAPSAASASSSSAVPQGQAVGLDDWCPHRGAPLSLGRVVEGKLVCGYHGLEMGCEGKTDRHARPARARLPAGAPPTRWSSATVIVWVWPGEAAKADPALLPALAWAEDPAWAFGGGLFHVKCDYRLMVDNLMDLTHEKYVHATSIGQQELDEVPAHTTAEGDVVITRREMNCA
jgi:vanillate O-demethylase monooxygenase subunit